MRRDTTTLGDDGFSLVEVMVAMALFMVISAGLFSILIAISRAQTNSARIDVAQAGVRAATDLIARDLLMVSAGARGGIFNQATGTPQIPAVILTDNYLGNGPDRLDILTVDGRVMSTLTTPYTAGSTINVDQPATFAPNDTLALTDLTSATLFVVTAVSATTLTVVAPTNPLARAGGYIAGNFALKVKPVTYYIDNAMWGADDPLLMLDPDGAIPAVVGGVTPGPAPAVPVAEGVEDFQVALGMDLNADGVIAPEIGLGANDDEWVYNFATDTAPTIANINALRSVRITLIARTVLRTVAPTSGALLGQRAKAEDHAAGVPDVYPRRLLKTEVSVRNFNL